jgi:hypothetical protein
MGTRNLICVVKDGKFKVAQYAQFDGYPAGQGVVALEFLRTADLDKFAAQVDKCYFGTDAEVEAAYSKYSNKDGWMTMEQAELMKASEHGHLSRDTGAGILTVIQESKKDSLMLKDSSSFAADSLFCEWAYIVDLDSKVLEVYQGFNKTHVPEGQRFAYLNEKCEKDNAEYYPIKLLAVFPLDALPEHQEFVDVLEALEGQGDEEMAMVLDKKP